MKQFEELGTFPDLLLDRSQQRHEKLNAFSHAVYRAKELSSQYGDLSYPFLLQDSVTLSATHPEFLHHFYYPEEGSVIIISEKIHSLSQFFTSNSYLLLYFSLIGFLCYLLHALLFADRLRAPSLTRRIQSIVILLLLVSMSAIGYTSTRLVTAQFESDNKRELEEKTQIILGELGAEFTHEEIFDDSRRDLINLKLKEYARLFNTPISLFDKDGRLFTTSETKLYDLGLAAGLVNPYAYAQLKNNRSSSEPVYEKAGSLTYVSFYTPVISKKSDLLGFINLPYFARQSALVDELSGIISALANVYVLLFVLSILAGLILAGYITQPLRLIQQQIANISLGKKNEKITWNSNDEIGRLVAEYNDMLVKLEESANLLAQSERESAWREMARQVAHEIKNPLTPMKLNLQYLQHVMKSDDVAFKEKFEKSANAIIEQIDALASIATEFSNFARLPSASLKPIPLSEIIETSVQLFKEDFRVNIVNTVSGSECMVKGDREQCLRVFNNVLKNALQAVESSHAPRIEITMRAAEDPEKLVISVSDNGCGISEREKENIFRPNFTTKTTGSGLGLSMVKNIMEGFEGRIWFESEEGNGTTFFLEFRKSAV
jgi:signal transduction histidine kinase